MYWTQWVVSHPHHHCTDSICASAITLFEYVLTFAQEIELFWQRSWRSVPFVLFVLNRYLNIFTWVFLLMVYWLPYFSTAEQPWVRWVCFTWRPLCSQITLVAVHLEVVSLLSMPIFKQTFELIQNRCTFLILYATIMGLVIQIICDGTVSPNLICWFDLTISKLLWPFEFMLSITITGSFLPCWLHSWLAQSSLILYGFLSPLFYIADLNVIWWLVDYLWVCPWI